MRLLAVIGLAAGLLFAVGCATQTKSGTEVRSTYRQVMATDLQQMSHDWNILWLADREYRLSRWHQR